MSGHVTMHSRTPDTRRRVVVGYDGSRAAVERAVEVAGDDGLVFVVHAYARPHGWLGRPNYQERLDAALDGAEATVRGLCDESGPLARVAWVPEIIGGDPEQAIADVAAARHADEIVLGSRRLGLMRGLHGGVAEALLRTTDVPVTVIPRAA